MRYTPVVLFASLLTLVVIPGRSAASQDVTFLGFTTSVPAGWTAKTPSSRMRLAEYDTPAVRDTVANVVVYFFGEGQGGSADANLKRWKGQFSNPDGSPVSEQVQHLTDGPFPITVASYRGTYARGIGAGSSAADARPNQELVAAVVETPKGTLFFQLYGPFAAVDAQRDGYLAFVRGLK
ncbi:MAG: hypothetical protein U0132_22640 [Gemmatimonadaceae bacterium]